MALIVFTVLLSPSIGTAQAGVVIDRIRSNHVIHCGATARPGLLEQDGRRVRGLFVDLCRAVGVAVDGPGVAVEAHAYEAAATYDPVRSSTDDLFFLSGAEIVDQHLADNILPGPTAFIETVAVMVADTDVSRKTDDLVGRPLCFLQGSPAHRGLEAWSAARHLPFVRMGYQEDIELYDAFDAKACQGLVGEITTLADVRLDGGPVRRAGRILPDALARFPLVAATGLGDAAFSAVVAWSLTVLRNADRPSADWVAGGTESLPIEAPAQGLATGWRKRLVDSVGSYGTLYDRNLGPGSPLRLPAGANSLAASGGSVLPLYSE